MQYTRNAQGVQKTYFHHCIRLNEHNVQIMNTQTVVSLLPDAVVECVTVSVASQLLIDPHHQTKHNTTTLPTSCNRCPAQLVRTIRAIREVNNCLSENRFTVKVTSLWCDLHWLIWRPARRLTKKSGSRRDKKNKKKTQKETQTRLSFLIQVPQTRRQRIKSGVEATCWDLAGTSGTPLIGSVTEGGRGTAPLAGTVAEFTK